MKIKQIDITEALDLTKENKSVYVITNPNKPAVKSLNNMAVGDVLKEHNEFIFFVIEES